MIKLNGYLITPTIFPDKTSQVWKIDEQFIGDVYPTITWEFENEAEFLHVAQLKFLLDHTLGFKDATLELPYLPYARQDKPVTNTSTFAFMPFVHLLNSLGFKQVKVFDPHNVELAQKCIENVKIEMPHHELFLKELNAMPVYPDYGASLRYHAADRGVIVFDKDREPLTGVIRGISLVEGIIEHCSYLIIDDLCDGGRTFIEVAKKLYEGGAKEVHLYVSHGIFSKGLEPLREAGIKRIFTRKGEVK
jgi:ribose-phosphate pyrophosphokinase